MTELILLGAGASVEAGVPHTYDMTRRIVDFFREDPSKARYARVVSFVVGGLLFQEGINGRDPLLAGVNVEALFNAIQLLAERSTLEAAPFVGSWHPMVQEFDRTRSGSPHLDRLYRLIYQGVTKEILAAFAKRPPPFAHSDIDRELIRAIEAGISSRRLTASSSNVGRKISDYLVQVTKSWLDALRDRSPSPGLDFDREFRSAVEKMRDRPGEGEIFSETNDLMIRALADVVWIDQAERVHYLSPLIGVVRAQNSLTIASLNYDNAVELLAQDAGVPFSTGIDGWSRTGSFAPSHEGVFLLKLHGSIDWSLLSNQLSTARPMLHSVIRQATSAEVHEPGFRPALIFGGRNKLTAEGPFLDLLRVFKQELSRCTVLTVIGYSFRDDHVNEYISQWLNESGEHTIRVVDPGFSQTPGTYGRQLLRLEGNKVEVIGKRAAAGLEELYGVTT